MEKTSNFKLAIRIIFGVAIVIAVLIFSGALPGFKKDNNTSGGIVEMWGVIPNEFIVPLVSNLNSDNGNEFKLVYEEKDAEDFESTLVEALASGTGPDLFILPHDLITSHKDKVLSISKEVVSERDFKGAFVEEGELYMGEDGIIGLPLFANPMLMYWNRDLFSSANIATPPSFWDEFIDIAPALTKSDITKKITQSAVSLGEFTNVLNAKDIISMIILQTGNPIVQVNNEGRVESTLTKNTEGVTVQQVDSALRFYTEFSNPIKDMYSWNRSLRNSKDMFTSEELAIYFGYASEFNDIRQKNPHLNFGIATVPQIRDAKNRLTYGRMSAVAIAKNSDNPQTALRVAILLSGRDFARSLSDSLQVAPARRDLLSEKQTDETKSVFYESALISRAWLDPDPKQSSAIFKTMVESITSGKLRISEAVANANLQMNMIK